jgi:hypothetical protein
LAPLLLRLWRPTIAVRKSESEEAMLGYAPPYLSHVHYPEFQSKPRL